MQGCALLQDGVNSYTKMDDINAIVVREKMSVCDVVHFEKLLNSDKHAVLMNFNPNKVIIL